MIKRRRVARSNSKAIPSYSLVRPKRALSARRARSSSGNNRSNIFSQLFGTLLKLLLLLGVVVGIIFLLLFVFFGPSWSNQSDQNIVIVPIDTDVQANKIILAHISPKTKKIEAVLLPADSSAKVIGGYGQYPVRSLYPLLSLEKKDTPFLRAAYSHALGKVVNQVWWSGDEALFIGEDRDLASRLSRKILLGRVHASADGQLGLLDRVWLFRFFNQVTPRTLDQRQLASFVFGNDLKDCRIGITNTTTQAGMGTGVSKVLEQSGFAVIRVTDEQTSQEKSVIKLDPSMESCTEVVNHALNLFPFKVEVEEQADLWATNRVNVHLFLGQDLAKELR